MHVRPRDMKYKKFCSKDCRTNFRFFSKIDKINSLLHPVYGRCWQWTGSLLDNRYGSMSRGGKTISSHRFSYEYFIGEIPVGLNVLHKCDNKVCVNPEHLFLGTYADNTEDMMKKGRDCTRNIIRKNQKLTIDNVKEIKNKFNIGFSNNRISKEYSVSERHINNIRKGNTWSWV